MTTEKTTGNPIEDVYPLSPLQQGMLFHSLLHEDSGVYLMQDRYRIGGAIDEVAFLESWRQVVALHPSLRASFQWKSQKQPVQVIHREVKVPLDTLDLRGLAAHEQEARIRSLLEDEQKVGFNLSKPPLIRFRLVRLADESYEFIRSFHHILMDAWCISLVTVDFLKVYEALCNDRTPELKSPRPFRDYIQWLQRQDAGKAEQFWRGQLQGLNAPTPLTVDNGVAHDRYTDAVLVDDQLIHLSEQQTQALAAFCRSRRITPNTFFQGVWSLLLSRYSGQRDVVFGVTVAGRPADLTGVAEMIGLFINTLPLRVSVDPDAPLGNWLNDLQGLNVDMRDFEHTPLTDIQGWSDFPRGETLFDSILVFENAPIDEQILEGGFQFSLEGMDHSVHTHYGLTVVILPGEQLGIRVSYDRERFEAATVERLLGHIASLVAGMLAAPDAPLGSFELLAAEERQQLLGNWAVNPHDFPLDQSYAQLFAHQVAQRGGQVAALCDGESLTYTELDQRSTRLAHALRKAGADEDQLIALAAPRGLALLTMMIAVFKTGAAMLPLEVNHPPERLREILSLSRAPLLVASEDCSALLDPLLSGLDQAPVALFAEACWKTGNDAPLPALGRPDSLAYVLFTSGSTGTPKGVMIEQRGMLNNIFGKVPALGLGTEDRIPQTASVAFDISVWQFLAAPVLGATVHILPDEVAHDPQRLLQVLASERLSVLEIVPSLMRTLLALCPCDLQLPDLRWVLPTGEALPPTVARDWFARFPDIALMNAYGPAECADDVAFQPIFAAPAAHISHMPIGQPTANNRLYVLDEALRPLPVGVAGEICVGGVGVGRGYLHDPQRTAEAFIEHPQLEGRVYRTGDLGRWRADGVIEYLGRRDQQVKLRGHRIELTEIEHRLAQHPNVREAAVLLRENSVGEAWLVAYWSAHDDTLGSDGLGEHLRAQLPPYMVPAAFVCLDKLPLNNNGKVDRKALAARVLDWQADTRRSIAPRNPLETAVAAIWAEVLGRDTIGVEDNFFTLGGHSLLATQIVARLRNHFKLDLPLRTLFEQPTVALLAVNIAARQADAAAPQAVALKAPKAQPRPALLPLSFSQQRLWFIEQLTPGTTLFNIPFALHLKGELNVEALHASLNDLLARHEILRTGIHGTDGLPCQRISESLDIVLPFEDLSGLTATAREGAQFIALQDTFEQPFDLTCPPLLRARLLRLAPGEHVLGIALHHLVSDAWSATIALRELALGYEARCNGAAAELPALPVQYADFALWQREHLQGAELKRQLDYWTSTLDRRDSDGSPLLALPTDHPRPSMQSYRAGIVQRELSADLSGRVQAFASRLGTTPFTVLFAGFAVLMHRLSGDTTVLVGTPVTHREQPGTEGLLGILLNNLAIRTDFVPQADFTALVQQVAERLRSGLQHQDLPFEQLVDSLQLPRSLSHAPLYQVMVAQQLAMESRLRFPGLEIEALDTPLRHSECDLDLHVLCPAHAPIQLELMFALDLFVADSARQTLASLEHLLEQMLADPQRPVAALPLLMDAEWQRTAMERNRTEMAVATHLTFAQLFEQQAAPDTLDPPRSSTERQVAMLWSELLKVPSTQIGRDSHFFHLGGHSLLAAVLFARLRQQFATVPPLRAVFEHPTLEALAALLGAPLQAPAATFVPAPRPARLPLSFEQQRLWFLEQLSAGGGEYNVVSAVQLDGELDTRALQAALNSVVQRHEILRSRIVRESDGELALVIEPQVDITLQLTTLEATTDAHWQQLSDDAIHAETGRRFDLASQVPIRATLLQRCGHAQALLLLTVHHCATDDASSQNLLDELGRCYSAHCQGTAAALPELVLQYPDYALWQREPGQQTAFSSQLEYWRGQLEDGDYLLDLPTEQGRPNLLAPAAGAVQLQLPPALVGRLRQFAQQRGATLYMLMLSAAQLLLGRYANQRDVRVGSPVAQRPFAELQPLIGCFVNTVVMRADLDPSLNFEGLLNQVRNRVLDAQQHQDVPFDQVVEHLKPARSLGQTPLFQVLFAMQNADSSCPQWPSLQVSERAVSAQATKYDLNWEVYDGEVLSVLLEYRAALFSETTARRWLEQWQQLLEAMLDAPQTRLADWSPLAVTERRRQLVEWNATERHYSGPTDLHTALSQQAALSPNAPALVFEGQRLSYAELDNRAQAVARALRAVGIGTDDIVPVCMERSVDMVVALLGIVHAGAAWLPLDPELPAGRMAFLIEDADAKVSLTQARWLSRLPAGHQAWTLDSLPQAPAFDPISVAASDLAYVLYTSGSTGQPKGVMNEHGALMNRLYWMQDAFPIGPNDRVLQKTPYSFDVSVWEFFWPLITGATLVVARPDGHRDPAYLSQLIQQEQVTTLHFVPSMLRAFVEEPSLVDCRSLRQVFASGEALPVDLVRRFMGQHPAALINLYGPTEAAIDVSVWHCSVDDVIVPIGKPIANLRLYILDESLQPLPIGSIGELYIGGVGVARGYLKRPDLTEERFLASPFIDGDRLYRTGDRCRFLADGNIEYLGRLDHQVKLRGQRIELGEIDAELLAQSGVRDAATLLLDQRLVSFWCGDADEAAIRSALSDSLPSHMLPSFFVQLDSLPLNSNGKLDRKALAATPLPEHHSDRPYTAPRTATQSALCELFSEVLDCASVGIEDHFFQLGGHSLLATRLVSRVRERLGVSLPLALVFEHPTVAALADYVHAATADESITAQPRPAALPLGLAQKRFWMLSRLVPDSREYHMPFALTLRGELQVRVLREAFEQVSQRHLVLRSRIVEVQGEPQLLIDDHGPALAVTAVATQDWTTTCATAQAELMAPFDLAAAAPWRAHLLQRQSSDENLLLVCLHHSATDGWAMQLLIDELTQAYAAGLEGQSPGWAPLEIDYVDFALWQQHPDTQARRNDSLDYWKKHLGQDDYQLDLPIDHPRGAEADRRARQLIVNLGAQRAESIRQFARQRGTTTYVVLASALSALLARYSGQREIRLGTPADQRDQPQSQTLLACLVNTLVIRSEVDQRAPAEQLLASLEADLRAAQAHADLPFATLVGAVAQHRDLNRTPLFQVLFSLNYGRVDSSQWPGLEVEEQTLPVIDAKFEQSWEVQDDGGDMTLALEYQAALFDESTMQRWSAQWCALLDALVAAPARTLIELFPQQQDQQQLDRWNATERHYSGPTDLHTALSQQAALSPNAPALVFEGQRLSYAELDNRAQAVARALRAVGIGTDDIVPVCMERSVDMVVALLGIVHAGAAWLPLDPELPAGRMAFLIEDADAKVSLTQARWLSRLPAGHQAWTLDSLPQAPAFDPISVAASDLAYVLYTSGSTGQPKGVMNEHGALMNRLYWMQDTFPIGPNDRVLQKTPYSFDVSVWEFFWPLITGATLVVARPDGHRDPAYLSQLIQQEQVTTLHFVPSMLRAFVEEPSLVDCRSLRQVFASGEALPVDLVRRFMGQHPAALVNLYGPTEAAIDVSVWRCSVDDVIVPIGKPIANLRLYILDESLQPLPIGSIGELYIGGVGVARGYLKRPDLTEERFLASPFIDGDRLYRTGDRCRFLADGNIEYLGRLDHQVKLRGQRIELGEIDAAVLNLPAITGACTLVIDNRLVAFYSSSAAQSGLDTLLAAELPAYMVPAVWVHVPTLPLNSNGKIDRKALAALPLPQTRKDYAAPLNALESLLCQLFGELLGESLTGGREVGTSDSFFALGGDSILGLKLISRLREHGYSLTPRDLFRSPTPAALAQVTTALLTQAEQGEVTGAMPLMPLHQWFFDQQQPQATHWNQSVLADSDRRLQLPLVQATLDRLVAHHDALRLRFAEVDGQWQAQIAPVAPAQLTCCEHPDQLLQVAQSLDLQHGPLFAAALLEGEPQRLYLVAHHLVVDAVSWTPLLEDFQQLYSGLERSEQPTLPAKTTSYRQWAEHLHAHAAKVAGEQRYWSTQISVNRPPVATVAERRTLSARWEATRTHQWLTESHAAYRTQPEELLIAALAATLAETEGRSDIVVDLERHGRDAPFDGLDVSRTVGWFTTLFPLRVSASGARGDQVRNAKEALRAVPGQGLGYGLLRQRGELPASHGDVLFNYLGHEQTPEGWLRASSLTPPSDVSPANRVTHAREVVAWLEDGVLRVEWHSVTPEADSRLPARLLEHLQALVEHCLDPQAGALMPSDFPLAKALNQKSLDKLLGKLKTKPNSQSQ
ncbi:amino acid adenylation domain-containing protein [Pseudomonas corrugata]|uniref:Amino acid adenylation domain-containing protein n=1 Tax=Pseudomonas corrugata TaxID=47879 RepID=A0A8B6UXD0_9PSED|nr:non-ribosomal peptide synthetase [Pseudomonas corrugata]QTH16557.1 amino acid adenylation domain-containing protein [Pseudomonas corrugata]